MTFQRFVKTTASPDKVDNTANMKQSISSFSKFSTESISDCMKRGAISAPQSITPQLTHSAKKNSSPSGTGQQPKRDKLSIKVLNIKRLADVCPNRDEVRTARPTCINRHNDYWLGGTEQHPIWICRICHPPAPGAERVSNSASQNALQATNEPQGM